MSLDKNEKQHDNNNPVKKPGLSSFVTSKMFTVLFFLSNLMLKFRKLSLVNVLTVHQHEKEQRHLMKFRIFVFETFYPK